MMHNETTDRPVYIKRFLGIATAAGMAGLSARHFRRVLEEDRVRTIQIGRKMFILGTDFEHWARTRNIDINPSSM